MRIDTRSLIKKLDRLSLQALEAAINLAVAQKMKEVSVEHWVTKILEQEGSLFGALLEHMDVAPEDFLKIIRAEAYDMRGSHTGVPALSSGITTLINDSWMLASVDYQAQEISSGHLFLCLAMNPGGFALNSLARAVLKDADLASLKQELKRLLAPSEGAPKALQVPAGGALHKFTNDLIKSAKAGTLDRAIGRHTEISQVIDILCRRKQNNPILVGESGVGKTAIVEELAYCILEGTVPESLKGAELRSLDYAALQAGANVQGEFESRIKDLLAEIQKASCKVILFVDEIHNFLGAQGKGAEAANLLKPALAQGLSVMGATTWTEYKKSFEKDAALTRRFHLVKVTEPSEQAALSIMHNVAELLEKHHSVRIEDSAVAASVSLSARYMNHLRLPDKAVSLLDSACTKVRLQQSMVPISLRELKEKIDLKARRLSRLKADFLVPKPLIEAAEKELAELEERYKQHELGWQGQLELAEKLRAARSAEDKEAHQLAAKELRALQSDAIRIADAVDAGLVAEILSNWTGIPITARGSAEEFEALLAFDEKMKERVVGQDHAIDSIVNTIRISKANMANPSKPIGVFLLVGESGVGKTETALSLAETIYGHESRIISINMSEYKEGHKVATLIGSPPGYVGYGEGGRLTEQVRRNPYSVILLDEMEKAHSNVHDLFLQVFDKGVLTDSEGTVVDFKNTVIIMTSNIGAKVIKDFCEARARAASGGATEGDSAAEGELSSRDADGSRAAEVEPPREDAAPESSEEETPDKAIGNAQEPSAPASEEDPISAEELEDLRLVLHAHLLKSLKPEFLGRLTVVPYLSLTNTILKAIIGLQLRKVSQRLRDNHKAEFVYDNKVVEKILNECKSSAIGARQIEQIISKDILPELSLAILELMAKGLCFGRVELTVQDGYFAMNFAGVQQAA